VKKCMRSKKEELYHAKSFALLFLVCLVMEYWQVTYTQRTMMLVHILILGATKSRRMGFVFRGKES